MTNEEAIELLTETKQGLLDLDISYVMVDALNIAIKSIETHIPKFPKIYKDDTPVCPVCRSVLDAGYRCRMCGQLIEWGKKYE